MKIFMIFFQPLFCLLSESYPDWKEVEEVNALFLLEQLHITPLLPGCRFFYDCDTKVGDRLLCKAFSLIKGLLWLS